MRTSLLNQESHFTVDIGNNMSMTEEGFLLCRNVAIARIGQQVYLPTEVPITAGPSGIVIIDREATEVFNPTTMDSFVGKPCAILHPGEGRITPDTWRKRAVGHAQNIRRGEGLESDVLQADLLIMDKDAIDVVQSGKMREVSCGYTADYIELGPGRGKQVNIRGNHIAIVPKGRCGALCAINDQEPKGEDMKFDWLKKLRPTLTTDQQKEVDTILATADAEAAALDQRLQTMEDSIRTVADGIKAIKDAFEKKEKEDKEKKAAEDEEIVKRKKEGEDCNAQRDAMSARLQDILYRSSILAPEVKQLTSDAAVKATSVKAFDESCCLHKRRVLNAAYATPGGKAAISPFVGDKAVDFMTVDCAMLDAAFIGASEIMKKSGPKPKITTKDFGAPKATAASINEANKKYWDARSGGK